MRKLLANSIAFGALAMFGIGAVLCIVSDIIDPAPPEFKYYPGSGKIK